MSKRNRIGPDSPNFKGGKTISTYGYVILSSKCWGEHIGRAEHRVIAERIVGRRLTRDEIVHHINGDKRDNRPANLQVMSRREHPRHHGNGREVLCRVCGEAKWYSQANLDRMAGDYACAKHNAKDYARKCRHCGGEFRGRRNRVVCVPCSGRKDRSAP